MSLLELPGSARGIDGPFQGLELIEEAGTVTIRTPPLDPAVAVALPPEEAAQLGEETQQKLRSALARTRVTYRITAPFPVVSHNAPRREGDTLIWEYDLEKLESGAGELGVRVTYKR